MRMSPPLAMALVSVGSFGLSVLGGVLAGTIALAGHTHPALVAGLTAGFAALLGTYLPHRLRAEVNRRGLTEREIAPIPAFSAAMAAVGTTTTALAIVFPVLW
jgi:hypothetical protein